jgi:hypothetical protein
MDRKLCVFNLGEKKANVKRKAELNAPSEMWHSAWKSSRLQDGA